LTKITHQCLQTTHPTHTYALAQIEKDHIQLLRRAVKDCRFWDDAERGIMLGVHQIRELVNAVRVSVGPIVYLCFNKKLSLKVKVIGEIPLRSRDLIVSMGDRMAARIVAAALEFLGVSSLYIDASKVVESGYIEQVDEEFYSDIAEKVVMSIQGADDEGCIPIITGCFGPFPPTQSMVEIHGPSYPTALSLLISSRLPSCSELCLINHHVTAIYTADPRVVPHALPLTHLTADEAGEMSVMGIGAHLMGSRDALLSSNGGIPMRIMGMDVAERMFGGVSEGGGTLVVPTGVEVKGRPSDRWTALIHRDEVTVFTIQARVRNEEDEDGVSGESGNADTLRLIPRIFQIVESHQGSVCSIVTGLKSVSVVVVSNDPDVQSLADAESGDEDEDPCHIGHRVNQSDRMLSDLEAVGIATMHRDFALLTLIGGRKGDVRMVGGVLDALSRADVAVRMCSQVLGGCGISLAVERAQVNLAVRIVHDACFIPA
ncbi:Aspartokinase, partial [Dinochytrium kinnereticum]